MLFFGSVRHTFKLLFTTSLLAGFGIVLTGCDFIDGYQGVYQGAYERDPFDSGGGTNRYPVTYPVNSQTGPTGGTTAAPPAGTTGQGMRPVAEAAVSRIRVYRNPNHPTQLLADVEGQLPNACTNLGAANYAFKGANFVFDVPLNPPQGANCANNSPKGFRETYALVPRNYVLNPGQYSVEVNGYVQPFQL